MTDRVLQYRPSLGGKGFELRFLRGCDFPIVVYRLDGAEYAAGGERREVSGVIFGNEITPPEMLISVNELIILVSIVQL